MASRLADHLNAARRSGFVGRSDEHTLFQSVLTADPPPFYLLYIFGPGGIGKTSLVGEFIATCHHTQIEAIHIDARNVAPSPEAFLNALKASMHLDSQENPLEALASQPHRRVILLDTYEKFEPLDDWLRESFLPQLAGNVIIVMAGRNPLASAWRVDAGWQQLVRTVSLRNLNPDESRQCLTQRRVPPEQHQAVLDFTHGHPLALSLVADVFDQRPGLHFQPEEAPDVIKTLLKHFVQKVPGPAHRRALEACALVHLTTEPLLSAMLTIPDIHELFEWLRGLSFIESGRSGLFPHDLAREVLVADLRWRNPDWYAELHRRAHAYYTTRKENTYGEEQRHILFEMMFLHRNNPAVRAAVKWQGASNVWTDTATETDIPALLAMVRQFEGDESAHLASHWIRCHLETVQVLRRGTQPEPLGFLMMLPLQEIPPEERKRDSATHAAWEYLQRYAPLRQGERATLFRFWMAQETYQAVSPIQSLLFINVVQHYLTTPGLAFTFFPCAEPDFWSQAFAYVDLVRIPEADFEVGGRCYGVYGHDWRAVPPAAWSKLLAERELAATPHPVSPPTLEPMIVLSEPDFAKAVHDTFRAYARPTILNGNPLLRSRFVMDVAGADADEPKRIDTLLTLLKETAESLQSAPRESKFYRALYRTYFNPAASQEQAAEILGLPFSTYRRHLKSGITQVTDLLWQREIGSMDKGVVSYHSI
jgi:hypothetical protein